MKFLAVIALIGLTQAIKVEQLVSADPAPAAAAAPAPAAAAAPAPAAEAKLPATPETTKPVTPAAAADAAKAAADAKADPAAAAADAAEGDTKKAEAKAAEVVRDYTSEEQTRKRMINIAKVGQEAIAWNVSNTKAIEEKWAAKA